MCCLASSVPWPKGFVNTRKKTLGISPPQKPSYATEVEAQQAKFQTKLKMKSHTAGSVVTPVMTVFDKY